LGERNGFLCVNPEASFRDIPLGAGAHPPGRGVGGRVPLLPQGAVDLLWTPGARKSTETGTDLARQEEGVGLADAALGGRGLRGGGEGEIAC